MTITPVADPPQIEEIIPDIVFDEDSYYLLNLSGKGSDNDNDTLTWVLEGVNPELYNVLEINHETFNLSGHLNKNGDNEVLLWLIDDSTEVLKANQTLWINITPVNDAPSEPSINFEITDGDAKTPGKQNLTVQFNADPPTDVDGEINFTYDWDFDNDGTVDETGINLVEFNYTFPDEGEYLVNLTVTDAGGLSNYTSVSVSVEKINTSGPVDDDIVDDDIINETDTDEDGLPDEWEQTHFGGLTEDGTGDFDNDGVSNLKEYQDGTDPTKAPDTPDDDIVDPDDDDDDTGFVGSPAFFGLIGAIVLILIIVVVIVLVLMLRKKKEPETTETLQEQTLQEQTLEQPVGPEQQPQQPTDPYGQPPTTPEDTGTDPFAQLAVQDAQAQQPPNQYTQQDLYAQPEAQPPVDQQPQDLYARPEQDPMVPVQEQPPVEQVPEEQPLEAVQDPMQEQTGEQEQTTNELFDL